jgi:hypothetical protein
MSRSRPNGPNTSVLDCSRSNIRSGNIPSSSIIGFGGIRAGTLTFADVRTGIAAGTDNS